MADTTDPTMLSSWYDSYSKANATRPDTAAASTVTPSAAVPTMAAAAPAAAVTNATATDWTPDTNSTVQGQLSGILKTGSPLLDRAETKAAQAANSRGLLNSTMAITAGQSALYDAALPIAQQDASTFADAGKTNAQQRTQVGLANASAANSSAQQAAGFQQQSNLQTQDLAAQAAQQQRELASRYDLASLDANSRMALQQADAANQQKLQAANAALQTGLQANDLAVKQSMQQYDAAVQQAMNGQNNENKLKLAQMDADTKTNLAEIEAKYKNQLQANSSMATTYQSYADAVTRIMLDTNLDADAKKSAIENQRVLYNNSLSLQSDVSGLKLGTLLAAGQATSAPPVASPAASPSADKIIDQMKDAWLRQQNQREQP